MNPSDITEPAKVWCIWRVGSGGPSIWQPNKESAESEAARIAAKTGGPVLVFEAVSVVEPQIFPTKVRAL